MSNESLPESHKIDPYQTPLTDATLPSVKRVLKRRGEDPLPNEVSLGDIPSVKVAGKRAAIVTLMPAAVLAVKFSGNDSIEVALIWFLVLFTWAIFVLIFVIALFQYFIKLMSRS